MEIRTAEPSDLEAINAIYNAEVETGTSTFDTAPRDDDSARVWFESHRSKRYPLLVAVEGADVLGWASLSPWSDRGAYSRTAEGSLFVREGARGSGVGEALTRELVGRARSAGLGVLIARIEHRNEASRRLLVKSGFEAVGVMHRVGEKFGRLLDVEIFELLL